MALTLVYYGRHVETSDGSSGIINANQQRGNTFNKISKNMWVLRVGLRCGYQSGSSAGLSRYGIYNVNSSLRSTTRKGYTASFNPSTLMVDASTGAVQRANVEVSDDGVRGNLAIMLYAGNRYGLWVTSKNYGMLHNMVQSSDISFTTDNQDFYQMANANSGPLSDVTSATDIGQQGWMSIWAEGYYNDPPNPPDTAVMAPSGSVNTVTPTFTGNFRDLEGRWGVSNGGADCGDEINQVNIVVKRSSDNVTMWNTTYTAVQADKDADSYTVPYTGSTLTRGVSYYQQVRVSDKFGEWSNFSSAVTFTPANQGFVTLDAACTPVSTATSGHIDAISGTVPSANSLLDFHYKWTHNTSLSTQNIKVYLYNAQGQLLATSPSIAKVTASSASPGTLDSVTFASTGFSPLSWSTQYQYAVQGQDSAGNWSDISNKQTFYTDYAPTIPTNLSPNNPPLPLTNPPVLQAKTSDQDDSYAGNLTLTFKIANTPVLTNPNFTGNVTGWTVDNATAGITQTFAYDNTLDNDSSGGSGKLNISASTAASGSHVDVRNDTWIACEAGESYEVKLGARTATTNLHVLVGVLWYNSSQVFLSSSFEADYAEATGAWTTRDSTFVAPANAKYCKIAARFYTAAANLVGSANIDTASMLQSTRRFRAATYNTSDFFWEYTMVADDLAFYATYYISAYAYDGVVYSGGLTTLDPSSYSVPATFVYAQGPSVTISSPTEGQVLTTSSTLLTWVSATQAQYLITIYDDATRAIAYQSNNGAYLVSTAQSQQIPAGFLHNNHTYDAYVYVKDGTGLSGVSTVRHFTVTYPALTAVTGFIANAEYATNDPWPTVNHLSWDQSPYATTGFSQFIIYRDDLTIPLARIYSPTITDFYDTTPASGVNHTYTIYQVVLQDTDYVMSPGSSDNSMVTLYGVVLSDVVNGMDYRVVMAYEGQRQFQRKNLSKRYFPINGDNPVTIRRKTRYWYSQNQFSIVTDSSATALQKRQQLLDLDEFGSGTICLRDEYGNVLFMAMDDLEVDPGTGLDDWVAKCNLTETRFTLGTQ